MADDGFGQGMFRLFFQTEENVGQAGRAVFRPRHFRHRGMPFRLGQQDTVYLPRGLQAFSVFDEDAVFGSLADAHHDGCRRGQSERAGTGDDEYGDQSQQAVRETVRRGECPPQGERKKGDADDDRYEYGRDAVHQPLHGGFAALRVLHHADDVGQYGVGSHFLGTETERAPLVDGTGENVRPFALGYGHRFAAQHAFVDVRTARDDGAVHGNPFAGTDGDGLPPLQVVDTDFTCFPTVVHDGDRTGLQPHELADGRRGAALGPFFQEPPQQDKGDDDARRFEIDVRLYAPCRPEFQKEHVEKAEDVGNERAVRHQGVHVGRAVPQLPPGVAVEIPSQPEDDGGGQCP